METKVIYSAPNELTTFNFFLFPSHLVSSNRFANSLVSLHLTRFQNLQQVPNLQHNSFTQLIQPGTKLKFKRVLFTQILQMGLNSGSNQLNQLTNNCQTQLASFKNNSVLHEPTIFSPCSIVLILRTSYS